MTPTLEPQMALLDLNPVFLSHTVTRIESENKAPKSRMSQAQLRGLPLGIVDGGSGTKVIQPSILRFSPILEWTHRDVWDFILASEVPYCCLYDKGYTSIGVLGETALNPFLAKDHPMGFCSVFTAKKETAEAAEQNVSLERIIGADRARPLLDAINTMFGKLGVVILGQNPVDLHNQQAIDALKGNSAHSPAWMLKDEKLEGMSSTQSAKSPPVNNDTASPFEWK